MSRLRSDGCVCDADDVEAIALIDDDVAGVPAVSSDSDDDVDDDDDDDDEDD